MTIRHLQIFRIVCRHLSITEAAYAMNMTQPAVSIAIKELEDHYNTKLFDRANRRIYLTGSGEALLRYTEHLLSEFEEMETVIRDKTGLSRVRLGVNVSVAETVLPDMLQKLYLKIQSIQLNVKIDNNQIIQEKLLSNDIDLAIVDSFAANENLQSVQILENEMCILCREDVYERTSITVNELAQQRLLLREQGSGSRVCVDTVFLRRGITVKPIIESTSTHSLIALAEGGLGFTIIPFQLAEKICRNKLLKTVTLSDDVFKRHYSLVYSNKKYMSTVMKEAVKVIEEMGELP